MQVFLSFGDSLCEGGQRQAALPPLILAHLWLQPPFLISQGCFFMQVFLSFGDSLCEGGQRQAALPPLILAHLWLQPPFLISQGCFFMHFFLLPANLSLGGH